MATLTTRPNATLVNNSVTITGGAGSLHAATSDDSDSTEMQLNAATDDCELGAAEPSVPAGSLVVSVGLRVRCRRESGSGAFPAPIFGLSPDGGATKFLDQKSISWSSATTIDLFTAGGLGVPYSLTPTDVRVYIEGGAMGSLSALIHELYVVTVHVPKPVVDVLTPTGTVNEDNSPPVTWEVS